MAVLFLMRSDNLALTKKDSCFVIIVRYSFVSKLFYINKNIHGSIEIWINFFFYNFNIKNRCSPFTDTVLVQQVDFLETILEETSDDLQSDSDRSGTTYWVGSDSETESVIHIRANRLAGKKYTWYTLKLRRHANFSRIKILSIEPRLSIIIKRKIIQQ